MATRAKASTSKAAKGPEATAAARSERGDALRRELEDPRYQAFWLLRIGFTVAPILFGLDKFFGVLTDWDRYLAPWIDHALPGTAHDVMLVVGAIEIVAGLVVAVRPRVGGYLVAAWLGGIIVNLLTHSGFYDVALRDFGLLLGALTLARLAMVYDRPLRLGR